MIMIATVTTRVAAPAVISAARTVRLSTTVLLARRDRGREIRCICSVGGCRLRSVDVRAGDIETASPGSAGWEAVYTANARRLTRLAVLLVGESAAHDLVADAVWRAVSSPGWRKVAAPDAYLTRSLMNLSHDRRRQAERRERREQIAFADRGGSPGHAGDVERSVVVRAAMSELGSEQLAVVFLHYWDDMTLAQVSDHLGIRLGTVRSHLHRAKQRLRPLLASEQEDML